MRYAQFRARLPRRSPAAGPALTADSERRLPEAPAGPRGVCAHIAQDHAQGGVARRIRPACSTIGCLPELGPAARRLLVQQREQSVRAGHLRRGLHHRRLADGAMHSGQSASGLAQPDTAVMCWVRANAQTAALVSPATSFVPPGTARLATLLVHGVVAAAGAEALRRVNAPAAAPQNCGCVAAGQQVHCVPPRVSLPAADKPGAAHALAARERLPAPRSPCAPG